MIQRGRFSFALLVLVLSVLSAYLCAAVFVAVNQLSLPRTDSAYGQSLTKTFTDPFVVLVAGTGASYAALIFFPIALFCLQRRDLLRCGVFVLGLTVLFIISAEFFAPRFAMLGAPLVTLAALLFCRFSRLELFRPHGASGDVA